MTGLRSITIRAGIHRATVPVHAATKRRLLREYRLAVRADRRRAAIRPGDRTNRVEARYAICVALDALATEAREAA